MEMKAKVVASNNGDGMSNGTDNKRTGTTEGDLGIGFGREGQAV
jgi:hypothetical protein